MKKDYKKAKQIQIKIAKFNLRLNETKFEGINAKELVKAYFGIELITKKHKKEIYLEKMNYFFENILKENENTKAYYVLKSIFEEDKENYHLLKRHYSSSRIIFEKSLHNVCIAINNLPEEKTLIPVFSATVLKNPHELDKNNLTGRLFIMFLVKLNKKAKPKNTEELAELYYNNNLLIDDLSNMVLCKNILGMKDGKEHLGWKGFIENSEPMQVTLYQLANIDSVNVYYKEVLIVENPAVFSYISNNLNDIPIVCTYGHIKLSGIVLLNFLKNKGVKLYYSGDIDPEGIKIADNLKQRYKESIELFGFDVMTYLHNVSNVWLFKQRLKKLENVQTEALKEVADVVINEKYAAYEEKNMENIIKLVKTFEKV